MRIPVLLASLLAATAASAGAGDALHRAQDREVDGDARGAAIAFHQALQRAEGLERAQAELLLARSLARLGLPASASAYYLRVLERGPGNPFYARALEGAAAVAPLDGPAAGALEKAPPDAVAALPPELAARLRASLALSAWRAGRYADAARFAEQVPASSPAYPRARYLTGLFTQRSDPAKALGIFAGIGTLDGDRYVALAEAKQLAQLDIGAHEADQLLGGEPRVGQRQCADGRRTAQETLDLDTFALGSGTPKHLAEHREAGDFANDYAVQRDRVGRENELEKTAPQYHQ